MFYVVGKGWVAAGDKLCLESGKTVTVTGSELEKLEKPIKVYNLEVLDNHTYFVGDKAVLVHNAYAVGAAGNSTDGKPKPARTKDFEVNSGSDIIPVNSEFGKSTFTSAENAKKSWIEGLLV